MKTAPSEELQGVAEEIVEVDVDENKIIGDPNAPNKDTNTGPVPAKLFQGLHNPLGTSDNPTLNVRSLVQTQNTPQASTSTSQLTPDTLKRMGYKRVHGYIVRAEPSKPKRSRWS